jgi:hypothetical protein
VLALDANRMNDDLIAKVDRAIANHEAIGVHMDNQDKLISELRAALLRVYLDVKFMVECHVIPNVLDDIIYVEARRVLGIEKPDSNRE